MHIITVMFSLGVFRGCLQWPWYCVLLPVLMLVILGRHLKLNLIMCLLGFGIGWLWQTTYLQLQLQARLPHAIEQQRLQLQVTVIEVKQNPDFSARLLVDSKYGLLQLSWFKAFKPLSPGQQWCLLVKLKRIHGFHNPGSLDYERYALVNGIRGRGYILSGTLE